MELQTVIIDCKSCDEDERSALVKKLSEKGIAVNYEYTKITDARGVLLVTDDREKASEAVLDGTALVTYMVSYKGTQCILEGLDEVDADFLNKMYERHCGIPWTIAETERLLIREFTTKDKVDIFPDISVDPEFTEKYIEKMYGFFGYGIWALISKQNSSIIGRAGVYNREGYDGLEIGYEIDGPYKGRGLASEACTAILQYVHDKLFQNEIYAMIEAENRISEKFIKKLGFIYTGTYDGYNRYRKYLTAENKRV